MDTESQRDPSAGMEDPIRVLHVDDDRAFAEAVATYLEDIDHRLDVTIETSGDDGLDRLSREQFDCIVSDYQLPAMDGIEFLSAVRDQSPELPFILFTGRGSEEVASEALSAGATDYLQKDAGTDQYEILANRIENAVRSHRATKRNKTLERVRRLSKDVNQVLLRATSQAELERRVCETVSAADPYEFAWIGGVNDETDRLEARASAGAGDGYLEEVTITVGDEPTGRGPAGRALRERRVDVSQNLQSDSDFEPWQAAASERGFQSVAAVPLTYGDASYGLFVVYADRPDAFDETERELLDELGSDIAHALDSIRTRRQLRAERDRRSALFEHAPDPVIASEIHDCGAEYPITDANAAFEEVFDFEAEDVVGEDVADVVVPPEYRATHEEFRDRVADGETVQAEVERITAEGPRDFILTVIPYGAEDGCADGCYAWFTDISDQREREAVLRRAHEVTGSLDTPFEEQVQALLELGRETLDTDYATFTQVGDDKCTYEAVAVPDDADLAAGNARPLEEMPYCVQVVETEQTLVCGRTDEVPDRAGDGQAVDRYLGAPVRVDDDVYGTFCFYDITADDDGFSDWETTLVELLSNWVGTEQTRRQTQAELERQNERLDEFASVVSHDLQNPLQVLETSLNLVNAEDPEHVERCRRAVDRMERLVEDLLTLARQGEADVTETTVDLETVVERCWDNVETQGATLHVETALTLAADDEKLRRLLENLVSNAVEHGTRDTDVDVTVTVGSLDDRGFYVADDGPGIPEDEREQVFQSGHSTSDEGTGFGLTIVERVADLHGWDVRVTDSAAGGARFEVTGVDEQSSDAESTNHN